LRDVVSVEQEEKKDIHRKLQNVENECMFELNWWTEKKKEDEFLQTADVMNQFKQENKNMIRIPNMLIK
jgi:hypothetical protein